MPLKDFCKVLGSRPNLPLGADSIEVQVPRTAGGFGPQDGVLQRRGNCKKEQ